MTNKQKFFIRRAHRFLGVFIGIQFLLWTVSGLYFSWANHDTVVSKPYKKEFKLEAGFKTSYVATDNNANYFNVVNNVKYVDTGKTNRWCEQDRAR